MLMFSIVTGTFFLYYNKENFLTLFSTLIILILLIVIIRYTMKWPPERILIPMFITV